MTAPPLRFLALVLGSWVCIRVAILSPGWWPEAAKRVTPATAISPALSRAEVATFAGIAATASATAAAAAAATAAKMPRARHQESRPTASLIRELPKKRGLPGAESFLGIPAPIPVGPAPEPGPLEQEPSLPVPVTLLDPIQAPAPPLAAPAERIWSASAWLLLRGEARGSALVPAGTLGGSQAGVRLRYRIGAGLSLSGRAYLPLRRRQGAEAAAGLEWQPIAAIPVAILAERRQALGREGRSAFSVIVHGGVSRALPGGLRLDAYAQAGIVGLRSRDAFVDASARLGARVGPVEVGAGAWGAAQPGAARLDAGPGVIYRLPLAGPNWRLEASWRFRISGEAAPGSGPALSLAADF